MERESTQVPATPGRQRALAPAVQLPTEWPREQSPQDKHLSVGKPTSSSLSMGLRHRAYSLPSLPLASLPHSSPPT